MLDTVNNISMLIITDINNAMNIPNIKFYGAPNFINHYTQLVHNNNKL